MEIPLRPVTGHNIAPEEYNSNRKYCNTPKSEPRIYIFLCSMMLHKVYFVRTADIIDDFDRQFSLPMKGGLVYLVLLAVHPTSEITAVNSRDRQR